MTAYFHNLHDRIGREKFSTLFPGLALFDNGSEFSNPGGIEKPGVKVSCCHPSAPNEKGTCEVTHEMVRRICPRKTSFDELGREFFDLAYSHINSYTRPGLNDKAAPDLFPFLYGGHIGIQEAFHIQKIASEDVVPKPSLMRDCLKEKAAAKGGGPVKQ